MEKLHFCKIPVKSNRSKELYGLRWVEKQPYEESYYEVAELPVIEFLHQPFNGWGRQFWISGAYAVEAVEFGFVIEKAMLFNGKYMTSLNVVLTMPNHDPDISTQYAATLGIHIADLLPIHYYLCKLFLPVQAYVHDSYQSELAYRKLVTLAPQVANRFAEWVDSFKTEKGIDGWQVLRYGLHF